MRAVDRVVIDTNVLLALSIFTDPLVAPLRAALAQGALLPVRSAATDAEWREVLARPALFAVPPERQAALIADWEAAALLVEVTATVPFRCRDPLDQKFLELAVAARARWLVTRDKALLKLRRKAARIGLAIVTPEAFAAGWLQPVADSP
jgi:putative PIN family toxin of toxin-antitoxin system